ncbi:MAG: M67 family metallopeptidase [Microthrixaceae bacterium]
MLCLHRRAYLELVAHALAGLPDEACGLLVGPPPEDPSAVDATVTLFEPCVNEAASSRIYRIGGRDLLRVERAADDTGRRIVGVMHSHTHTEPYPSPTDVEAAVDPSWHYVIVSLRFDEPRLRSYRMVEGEIIEEPVELID